MTFIPPKYNKHALATFYPTLRSRVNDYFTENDISRNANAAMVTKTVILLIVYLAPLGLLYFGNVESKWMVFGLWVIMGFGMAGIGMAVMHDANHGAYSKNTKVNNLIGYLLNMVGGNADFWKIQHNVLHHTYTNVTGADEDIDTPPFLRFSPHEERKWIHRYQHWYALFFYGFLTIPWITSKELQQLNDYRKKGLIPGGKPFRNLLIRSIVWKIGYYVYLLVLPMLLTPVSPWFTLICFLTMHYIASFLLGMIFQTAHVMPSLDFPKPDETGNLENNWAVHQLYTTTNYAPKSRVFAWFVGGLNFQVEHHLFPNICHVHYKRISKIVKETAQEFGLPYHSQRNFLDAVRGHLQILKTLGRQDHLPVPAGIPMEEMQSV